MMKKMTNNENLAKKQIIIRRKTRQRDMHLIVHLIIKKTPKMFLKPSMLKEHFFGLSIKIFDHNQPKTLVLV
jgi:hypothetical protein